MDFNIQAMKKHVLFSFIKPERNDGFWFLCLKHAYSLEVKGSLRCLKNDEVEIDAEGEEPDLKKFYEWLTSFEDIRVKLTFLEPLPKQSHYREFDIYLLPNLNN